MTKLERIYDSLDITKWYGEFPEPLHITDFDVTSKGLVGRVKSTLLNLALLYSNGTNTHIKFSQEDSYATSDYTEICVALGDLSLKLPLYIRISGFFGRFIHEAAHFRYTNPEEEALIKSKGYGTKVDATSSFKLHNKSKLVSQLANILEDRRIEHRMSVDFPGYNRYLQAARKIESSLYISRKENSTSLDFNKALMSYITLTVLYPGVLEHKKYLKDQFDWFISTPLRERINEIVGSSADSTYLSVLNKALLLAELFEKSDPMIEVKGISSPLSELLQKDSSENADTDEMTEAAKIIAELTSSKFKDALEETINDGEISEAVKDKDAETPERMVDSGNAFTDKLYDNISIMQPTRRPAIDQSYKSLASKLRANFTAYSAQMSKTRVTFEQPEGDLDEDELYNARNARDIFYDEEPMPDDSLEIILLVDQSGSMSGSRIKKQAVLSNAICTAFNNHPKINFQAYGHTANHASGYEGLVIIPYVNKNHKYLPEEVGSMEALSNNADGYALEYIYTKFSKDKKSNKLVLMLSDGQPSARSYGGSSANKHVHDVVKAGLAKGIKTLSIAIGDFYQKDLYDEYIPYKGDSIGQEILRWISKNFAKRSAGVVF